MDARKEETGGPGEFDAFRQNKKMNDEKRLMITNTVRKTKKGGRECKNGETVNLAQEGGGAPRCEVLKKKKIDFPFALQGSGGGGKRIRNRERCTASRNKGAKTTNRS